MSLSVESLTTRTLFRAIANNYHHRAVIKDPRVVRRLRSRRRCLIVHVVAAFCESRERRLHRGARMHDSLRRVADEIQCHKAGRPAGWLASERARERGAHKYLDDRGPIARPRGCVRTADDAPPRPRARSRVQLASNGCTHPAPISN